MELECLACSFFLGDGKDQMMHVIQLHCMAVGVNFPMRMLSDLGDSLTVAVDVQVWTATVVHCLVRIPDSWGASGLDAFSYYGHPP